MPKPSLENAVFDKNGTILPIEDFNGVLAVTFERYSINETHRMPHVSVKLSNGHFISIFPPTAAKLFKQIRQTHPNAPLNSIIAAVEFVIETKLPIAVRRRVCHNFEKDDFVYWRYTVEN